MITGLPDPLPSPGRCQSSSARCIAHIDYVGKGAICKRKSRFVDRIVIQATGEEKVAELLEKSYWDFVADKDAGDLSGQLATVFFPAEKVR